MKKLVLFIMLLWGAHVSNAQTTHPSGVTGCVGRWNFSSINGLTALTLGDKSGNNNTATPNDLIGANGFRNLPNRAMLFNGTSSYALIPNAPNLSTNAITMVSLVKMSGYYSGTCQYSQIVAKGYGLNGTPYNDQGVYGMSLTDQIYDNGDCATFDANHQQLSVQTGPLVANSTPTPSNFTSLNTWYMIAASYDGDSVKYYQVVMDPTTYVAAVAPIFTAKLNMPMGNNSQDLSIGRIMSALYPYYFNGVMDEVTLFNKKLNMYEMQAVYNYLWNTAYISDTLSTTMCPGHTVPVAYVSNDTLNANNIFTVQLSDATGSFTNAVTVGSVMDNKSGVINCVIPNNTPTGNGYRMRILTSSPSNNTPGLQVIDNGFNISINNAAPPTPAITISASPSTHVNPGQVVVFTSTVVNAGPNPTYKWKKNGVAIPGATGPTYSTSNFVNTDIITLEVTNNAICNTATGISNQAVMVVSTGVQQVGVNGVMSVYPNPSRGNFVIAGIANGMTAHAEVLNAVGQVVYSNTVNSNETVHTDLPNGVYMLRVRADDQTQVLRLSIEK
jgi:Secretion system C-terminal sorting domain/Concanavalin A-like lectin/glucanases superfamily